MSTKGVNTVLITGVNTNSSVLATTSTASTRDCACVVVSDWLVGHLDVMHIAGCRVAA